MYFRIFGILAVSLIAENLRIKKSYEKVRRPGLFDHGKRIFARHRRTQLNPGNIFLWPLKGASMELNERLRHIAELVPEGSVIADIGTDHAYLPVYLVRSGRCPRAIASDVRPGPLAAARQTVREAGLEARIDLRLGDGLTVLKPGEAEVAVLSGMGGPLIVRVLEAAPDVRQGMKRLILQPMVAAALVRRWLAGNGFRLADEDLVADGGRIYEIIAAEPVVEPFGERAGERDRFLPGRPDLMFEIGPRLLEKKHPLVPVLVKERIDHLRRIAAEAARSADPWATERSETLASLADKLEEMVRCWPKSDT